MNTILEHLDVLLKIAALGQLFIAGLGLALPRIMGWKSHIAAMPLLIREVFVIHGWFISFTCAIFGVLSFRFAEAIAQQEHEMLRWFAALVGAFWALRCVMQWTHYSREHWRGIPRETVIHWLLFFGYGAWAAVYFLAAFHP